MRWGDVLGRPRVAVPRGDVKGRFGMALCCGDAGRVTVR